MKEWRQKVWVKSYCLKKLNCACKPISFLLNSHLRGNNSKDYNVLTLSFQIKVAEKLRTQVKLALEIPYYITCFGLKKIGKAPVSPYFGIHAIGCWYSHSQCQKVPRAPLHSTWHSQPQKMHTLSKEFPFTSNLI